MPPATSPDAKVNSPQPVEKKSPGEGLSAFLGRILDQLSLSSWLPAAMLVGNATLLLKLSSQSKLNPGQAVTELTKNTLGLLVVLTFALVLVTIVTQAFEFEVIRLLEGYFDSAFRPVQLPAALRIRRHARKRSWLLARLHRSEQAAFMQARAAMLSLPSPIGRAYLDIIEDEVFGRQHPADLADGLRAEALAIDWSLYVGADVLYRVDGLNARVKAYPDQHRVLPTRLGNVLRAAEDGLPLAPGENLEGFVIRHNDTLPETLKSEQKDYRIRLDMYCSLVLVFLILTVLSAITLSPPATEWVTAGVAAAYGGLTYVSYVAAIASARGYGAALQEIGRQVERAQEEKQSAGNSPPSRARWYQVLLHRHSV
jgi:hypothetical protein